MLCRFCSRTVQQL